MPNAVTNLIATNAKQESSWLAAGVTALGTLQQTGTIDVVSLVPPQYQGIAIAASGLLALLLRNLRTKSTKAPQ